MSDDVFRPGGDGNNDANDHVSEATRDSGVTDDLDSIFDLLSNSRRRYLLYYLHDQENGVGTLEGAAEAVCDYEVLGTGAAADPDLDAVRVGLEHSHLPRCEAAGVIDYDRRSGAIRADESSKVTEWLEHARYSELD